MTESGEIYYDNVFDSEVTVVKADGETVMVEDFVGGEGHRELRREIDWEHNVSVGRYEKVGEIDYEQRKMDELEEEDHDAYVAMGEVELEEESEKGIFDY